MGSTSKGRWLGLVLFLLSGLVSATTFTADLKTLTGGISSAYVHLELKNCGTYIPTSAGVRVPPYVDIQANGVGHISAIVADSSTVTCGTSIGAVYYNVTVCLKGRTCPRDSLFGADYDVVGPTFDLNSAAPKLGLPPPTPINTPKMVFSMELENPSPLDNGEWHYEFARATRLFSIACDMPADSTGSVPINFEIRSAPNITGTKVLANDLVCTPAGDYIQNLAGLATVPGSLPGSPHPLALNVGEISGGNVTKLRVHVIYQPQ